MRDITTTFRHIIKNTPDINFYLGGDFYWSPDKQAIFHPEIKSIPDLQQLLHEIGHAKLDHRRYRSDASLVNMELEAWQYATTKLAPQYQIELTIEDAIVIDSLDSYRQWLHDRSVCPNCQAVGMEESPRDYQCLVCQQRWTVNEARSCQLRRYKQ